LTVSISPAKGNAGDTFTCTPSATGATSYTYKWQDNGVDIPGATANTYANDKTWGTINLNCLATPVNSNGSGTPGVAAADSIMRWAGWIALEGSQALTAQAIDTGRVMNGQVHHLLMSGTTPTGNITFEGVGPVALASHADYKTQASGGGRTCMLWRKANSDQTLNFQFSHNWGGSVRHIFKSVGYDDNIVMVGGGISTNNASPTTINLNVPANGAVLAQGQVYDGINDPTGIQHFTGATFMKSSVGAFESAGFGFLNSADAALAVTFTKASGGASAKAGFGVVLTPL
jgi:hypothetical protein